MRYGLILALLLILAGSLAAQPEEQGESSDAIEDIRAFVQISDRVGTSGQPTEAQIQSIGEAGYEVLINLAPARERANLKEGFWVTSQGMAYVQIPVDFQNPALRDLEFFFAVMEANKDRKVFVHCFANMRVSSFIYLYRIIKEGAASSAAEVDLHKVWEPNENWSPFIESALAKSSKTED